MDIYECIAVATTGSDGKPPVQPTRRDMRISELNAHKAARVAAEAAINAIENQRGDVLPEDQWAELCDALVADFEEAIPEALGDL